MSFRLSRRSVLPGLAATRARPEALYGAPVETVSDPATGCTAFLPQ